MNYNLTISYLKDKGHRLTNTRKSIIQIFSEAKRPLSVNTIEKRLKNQDVNVNKTTVYREIDFLSKNNLVKEIFISKKRCHYESADLKHHHHLICDKCGKIENITNCLMVNLEKKVYKKRGFKIDRHLLEFYGTCANCS
jgi:Fe2+ or Zn2+ uptake regulation protein